jgi:hypothetical protein
MADKPVHIGGPVRRKKAAAAAAECAQQPRENLTTAAGAEINLCAH